jgi:HSP20 family protein
MDPFDMFRMSPFALMRRFSEEMDQYFDQLGAGRRDSGMTAANGGLFAPPMEVFERDGQLIVRADLPGLTKDDVHVEVTDDALLITGERRSEHEERQGGTFHSERSYGSFRRQIPLPEGVSADQAKASFKDGVLEVSMPAPQRPARGRQIDIQSATTPGDAAPSASAPQEHEHVPTTAR